MVGMLTLVFFWVCSSALLLTAGICHTVTGRSDVIHLGTFGSVLGRKEQASRQWEEGRVRKEGKT